MTDLPKYKLTTVPAGAGAAIGAKRLWGLSLIGGSADTVVICEDAATDTGTTKYSDTVLAKTSSHVCLEEYGGIPFDTDIFVKVTGTAGVAYVWTS
jgi:hypothetical protein